jgi:hypothetical protein
MKRVKTFDLVIGFNTILIVLIAVVAFPITSFALIPPTPLPLSLVKGESMPVMEPNTQRIHVFMQGVNGTLMERYETEDGWHWFDHGLPPGTAVAAPPAAVAWAETGGTLRFSVFVPGLNGHLFERWYDGTLWHWLSHGVPPLQTTSAAVQPTPPPAFTSQLTMVTWLDNFQGRISVFAVSSDRRLFEYLYDPKQNEWTWRDHDRPSSELNTESPVLAFLFQTPIPGGFSTVIHVFLRSAFNFLVERTGGGADPINSWQWTTHIELHSFTGRLSGYAWTGATKSTMIAFPPSNKIDIFAQLYVYSGPSPGIYLGRYKFNGSAWTSSIYEGAPPLDSDPVAVPSVLPPSYSNVYVDDNPHLKVFAKLPGRYYEDVNVVAELDAETGRWFERPVPIEVGQESEPYRFALASSPTAITLRNGINTEIHVFANRTSGTLLEGIRSGDANGSIWSWNDRHGPDGIGLQASGVVRGRGCNDSASILRLLPAWLPVEPDDHIQTLEGVVLKSHISSEDAPFNHTFLTPKQQMGAHGLKVAHDWNIIVAPDVKYQDLMSDANFLNEGAAVEVEWETDYGNDFYLPPDAVPGMGDRIYMKGRWIYDCGHPPYRTEIHPPAALVVMRREPFVPRDYGLSDSSSGPVPATQAIVRLSHFGGPTYFWSPPCQVSGNLNLKDISFGDELEAYFNHQVDFADLKLSPDFWCYTEYVWGRGGHDEIGDVEFELPLPPKPSSEAQPAVFVGPNEINPQTQCEVVSITYNGNSNSFHARIPGCNTALESVYSTTFRVFAYWRSGEGPVGNPAAQSLNVCFTPEYLKPHGDWSEELTMLYVGANGHFVQARTDGKPACIPANLDEGQALVISAHGFECDFSCGQVPEDAFPRFEWSARGSIPRDFASEPDDLLGTILHVLPADAVSSLKTFRVCSQTNFQTDRSTSLTDCDYRVNFSVVSR